MPTQAVPRQISDRAIKVWDAASGEANRKREGALTLGGLRADAVIQKNRIAIVKASGRELATHIRNVKRKIRRLSRALERMGATCYASL